jgi:hypothetical protein
MSFFSWIRLLRNHLDALRGQISKPAEVWLLVRMLGWSLALPMLKVALPLPTLVRLMRSRGRNARRDDKREAQITTLAAWVFRTRPRSSRNNCLERALVTYRYLGRANTRPELVVGMSGRSGDVRGHVWVTVDGEPVHESSAEVERFVPMLVFASDGTPLNTERARPSGAPVEERDQTPRLPSAERSR